MTENFIMIEDSRARAFFLTIWTPSLQTNLKFWNCDRTRYQVGDWESSDKGFIRPVIGDAFLTKSPEVPGYCFSGAGKGVFTDLYLAESNAIDGHDYEIIKWGMVLFNYTNGYDSVKSNGRGEVRQSWTMNFEPGPIWWKKPTTNDVLQVANKRIAQNRGK